MIIFATAIVFGPDLTSLSLGGFKMDLLRETREDLREVRSAVVNLQSQKQAQGRRPQPVPANHAGPGPSAVPW